MGCKIGAKRVIIRDFVWRQRRETEWWLVVIVVAICGPIFHLHTACAKIWMFKITSDRYCVAVNTQFVEFGKLPKRKLKTR